MRKETQISAFVSRTTKAAIETHVRATGRKKSYVVETALLHHLQALRELPLDVIVPTKVVVSRQSLETIAERIASPKPTAALRELMKPRGD